MAHPAPIVVHFDLKAGATPLPLPCTHQNIGDEYFEGNKLTLAGLQYVNKTYLGTCFYRDDAGGRTVSEFVSAHHKKPLTPNGWSSMVSMPLVPTLFLDY